MRTTLTLDSDILNAARQIAAARCMSIGDVISELARRGLEARATGVVRHGFPVFDVPQGARPLTPADLQLDEDEA